MNGSKARIAVLVSGGGTNLQAILDAGNRGEIPHGEVTLVISDRAGAYALERAAKAGIPALEINKKACGGQAAFEEKLAAALEENRTDIIVLAGFLSILTENFTSKYPRRIVNVHPSLIPSFCGAGFYGLKVHEAALAIAQKAVEILDGDTPEVLQRRVMEQAEWIILPQSVEKVCKEIVSGD